VQDNAGCVENAEWQDGVMEEGDCGLENMERWGRRRGTGGNLKQRCGTLGRRGNELWMFWMVYCTKMLLGSEMQNGDDALR
jgi:hypothetical protein